MNGAWSGDQWHVERRDDVVTLTHQGREYTFHLTPDGNLDLSRSWFRWFVVGDGGRHRLKGLPSREVRALRTALGHARLSGDIAAAVRWAQGADDLLKWGEQNRRWIPRERVDEVERSRP